MSQFRSAPLFNAQTRSPIAKLGCGAVVCAWVAVMLTGVQAQAQVAEPKVLILFDTSNSMLLDLAGSSTFGDGSVDYPGIDTNGDGLPNDSRLYIAKQALRQVVEDSQVEVEFGLMRFYQEEGQDILGAEAMWYQDSINYRGRDNCSNDGQVLVDIDANSRDSILTWMDGTETWPSNKELRGAGNTPLAQGLTGAQSYFTNEVIPNDTARECRSYYVLLVADGEQFCPGGAGGDPAAAAFALRELTFTLFGQFSIKTWVVGFGPEVQGAEQLNQIARSGGTALNANGATDLIGGTALFARDHAQLSEVLAEVLEAIDPDEICDGRDNDCDGRVDEGFAGLGDACEDGVGQCLRRGTQICSPSGTTVICSETAGPRGSEICDDLDNDCDGDVDEGLFNACGTCGPTPTEVCDGNDNDCDSQIDEAVLNVCGACGPVPSETCNGVDDDCDGQFDEGVLNVCGGCGPIPEEVCDGSDNDCDNAIDEGFDARCGECVADGPEVCDDRDNDCDALIDEGTRNACDTCGPVPEETCNGLDDNCDGTIDEGVLSACGNCDPVPVEVCDGEDNDCDGVADEEVRNACGRCGPLPEEICDNVSNDCDGEIDEGAVCPDAREVCINGECAEPCQQGECFGGTVCNTDDWCVTPCDSAQCQDGWVCIDGVCADPCAGIDCPAQSACSYGACVDASCEVTGCGQDEICTQGACVDDPCADVDCGDTLGCRDGACFGTCLDVECPPGQSCEGGVCVDDPCAGRECPFGQICDAGSCVEDPCSGVVCAAGEACVDGTCAEDPCLRTTCPEGTTCRIGECVPDDAGNGQTGNGEEGEGGSTSGGETSPGETSDPDGEGDGGDQAPGPEACACKAPAAPPAAPGGWLLLLGAWVLILRARRGA